VAIMRGKVCLITGATNGIGLETARCLAEKGATVVLVGRSPEKTAKVVEELRRSTANQNIDSLLADLSLMSEVRKLAEQFQSRYDRLDVLINNAGGVFSRRHVTAEGLELTFALNHINYFLLTHLLLDILKDTAPSRIVNVASEAHRPYKLDFDNLQGEKRYNAFHIYGRTKLMNIMFTYALARRLTGTGVTVNALEPGFVNSGFAKNNNIFWKIAMMAARPLTKSPEEGAQSSCYLSASPEVSQISGRYFSNCSQIKPNDAAIDIQAQERLWDISAEITGVGHREASQFAAV
jgi:NAD(P)-dependent dehydrogenase (short-subunit alcohol dehydrogenase family)